MPSSLYRCRECGFTAPTDEIGVAIMMAHLTEHDREVHDPKAVPPPQVDEVPDGAS